LQRGQMGAAALLYHLYRMMLFGVWLPHKLPLCLFISCASVVQQAFLSFLGGATLGTACQMAYTREKAPRPAK
jgi:hypothetical protein